MIRIKTAPCHYVISAQRIISANIFFLILNGLCKVGIFFYLLKLFWAGRVLVCPVYYCFWPSKDLLLKQWVKITYKLNIYLYTPGGLSRIYVNWPFHRSSCDLALYKPSGDNWGQITNLYHFGPTRKKQTNNRMLSENLNSFIIIIFNFHFKLNSADPKFFPSKIYILFFTNYRWINL